MAEIAKKIINHLNKNNLCKAYELYVQNSNKGIEHIINNIKDEFLN